MESHSALCARMGAVGAVLCVHAPTLFHEALWGHPIAQRVTRSQLQVVTLKLAAHFEVCAHCVTGVGCSYAWTSTAF
jgi:hypothetical protein